LKKFWKNFFSVLPIKGPFLDIFRKNFCKGIVPPIWTPLFTLYKGGYGRGEGVHPSTPLYGRGVQTNFQTPDGGG